MASWYDIFENEYAGVDKLMERPTEETKMSEMTNVKTMREWRVLDVMISVVNEVKKYIKGLDEHDKIDDDAVQKLKFVEGAAKTMCQKKRMQVFHHKFVPSEPAFPRSSYKFCDANFQCEFFYGDGNKRCFMQHYVYNSIFADINIALQHINSKKVLVREINKTLDTVSYVLNHMYDEYKNAHVCI